MDGKFRPMAMPHLKKLHEDMLAKGEQRCIFDYSWNGLELSVFFLADSSPFALGLGKKGEKRDFIEFEIEERSCLIDTYLGDGYDRFCEFLEIPPAIGRCFSPKNFFKDLDEHAPVKIASKDGKTPEKPTIDLSRITEPEKVFFAGWRDNNKWNVRVSDENLAKTRLLHGESAYARCKKSNLSSCWSAKQKRKGSNTTTNSLDF